ncbi:MAG: MATE family efflux transporter [Clostridiales bacterium]|nr:MATE family efflux transporter [Clostridiales bacterium]
MSTSKAMINNLTTGNVTSQLLKFAYPFALSNLLQVTYNIVDMILVGQFIGKEGLSAVSIGSDLMSFGMLLGFGFASAGQIMISQYVGLDNKKAISRTIGTMFTFILSISIVLSFIALGSADIMLRLLRTPAAVFSQARSYTYVSFCGLFFIFGYNCISAILRGMGDSKRPFVFIAIASVVNFVLTLLFVAVFHLGVAGAALATIIGQAVSFIFALIYLYKKKESFGFDFKPKSFAIEKAKLKMLARLGIPLALQNAAVMVSMLFVNSHINSYGVVASAVTGIGNKLRSVMSIISNSIGTAGSAMIGQNLGAGKPERVKRIVNTTLLICIGAFLVISIPFIVFSKQVFMIFSSDPEVLEMAPSYMWVLTVYFLTFALMSPYKAVVNGLGHASLGFAIGIMDGVITRIGLAVLLGITFNMGVMGFWFGSAAAGITAALIGGIYYYSGRWKKRKLLVDMK